MGKYELECVCTQFVTVHTSMYMVRTGMYLVCTKTWNRQVLWTRGCDSLRQDAACRASDKRGKETREGSEGDSA